MMYDVGFNKTGLPRALMLRQDSVTMLFQWTAWLYVMRLVKSIPQGGKGAVKTNMLHHVNVHYLAFVTARRYSSDH